MEPLEGSNTSHFSGRNSESPVQLNIKTLNSRVHSFCVDKNIVVSGLKEKIASQIGVPVGQQRLIFRGKALKDDHPLSEYNVENGDTLHLVERQLQPPPGSGFGSEETTSSNGDRGQNSNAGRSRTRTGQISHNIVLGTINVGDPGEVVVPDVSQVLGAVLNSIGIGNQAGATQLGFQTLQGDETEGSQVDVGSRIHGGNQTAPWQTLHHPSPSNSMQMPLGAAIAVPTLNMPIPDSLHTLTEFMNQMERAFRQNGDLLNQSPSAGEDQATPELPMNSHGVPTVEALSAVLRHAQRLLTDHAAPALSHTASHFNQDGSFTDPTVRRQIQTESVQLGVAMQHLGALLLELGRTILTLRMGQLPDETFVQAGPAVYISSSGPNPLMVQPFPLQTSSLFGGLSGITTSPVAVAPVGVGSMPSNVNIHIHTGASMAPPDPPLGSRAPHGERSSQAESINAIEPGDSAQALGLSGVNVNATAVPSPPTLVPVSHATPHGTGYSHQKAQTGAGQSGHAESLKLPLRSNQVNDLNASSGVPLGLGLGALQPRSRGRLTKAQSNNSDGASASNQKQETREVGERVLRSLSSLSKKGKTNALPSSQTPSLARGIAGSMPTASVDSQTDVSDAISQLLQSPALEGLLAGAAQQTGAGSPDMFRDVLQQFTHNPEMRNTVNQIAQQIDHHDLGSMFSNLERGGGGQIHLSRMMQQMMPIVSQTLSTPQMTSPMESVPPSQRRSRRETAPLNNDPQIDLRQVARRLENHGSSEEIFRSLVSRSLSFSSNGGAGERVVNEICSQGGLAQEFMEMLRRDISRRLHHEMDRI